MINIKNYVKVNDCIATSGQPGRDEFPEIANAGYSAVVNLATGTSPDAIPDEGEVTADEGMAYYHIPVKWTSPELSDLDRFFSVMDDLQDRKVWVHCVVNKRASAFVYLYRLIELGVPEEEARAPIDEVWEPDEIWRGFIDHAKEIYMPGR
ncbi:MAG: protein tyrosine phosphatase family protein [Thermodesulfobacteriota bacterium]